MGRERGKAISLTNEQAKELRMQVFVQAVRDCAIRHGGAYIPFSQCLQPVKALIESMPGTSGGICRALAAKWIAQHANDDSLWNWLFYPNTTQIKLGCIAELMIQFHEGVSPQGKFNNPTVQNPGNLTGGNYQDLVMENYLGIYGLKKRGITKDLITGFQNRPPANAGSSIANRLSIKWLNGVGYVHIYTGGGGSAHSTAAFVGSQDIAFFDPNFGEFYFTDQAKFRAFFVEFWEISGYSRSWGGFQLDPYARAIKFR